MTRSEVIKQALRCGELKGQAILEALSQAGFKVDYIEMAEYLDAMDDVQFVTDSATWRLKNAK